MPGRLTSSVIIANVENALLTVTSLVLFFALTSGTSGLSGGTTWALSLQACLLFVTILMILLWTSLRKSTTLPEGKVGRSISDASNVYCGSVFCIFVYYLVFFLKAVILRSEISDTAYVVTSSSGNWTYKSSERLDWIQAAVGSSGWELRGQVYESSTVSIPILGQVTVGVSVSYLSIMLLVSMYAAYSATPEGSYNPLFLEPRMLISCNIFMVLGMPQAVHHAFRDCGGSTEGLGGYFAVLIFLAVTFFDNALVYSVIWLASSLGKRAKDSRERVYESAYVKGALQPAILTVLSLVPCLVAVGDTSSGAAVVVSSLILSILSTLSAWMSFQPPPRPAAKTEVLAKDETREENISKQAGQIQMMMPKSAQSLFRISGGHEKAGRYNA